MSIKAKPTFSLKDQLFNAESVGALSSALERVYPVFDKQAYDSTVLAQFSSLALKERIDCLVTTLEYHLPQRFEQALDVLLKALPAPLDPSKTDDDFGQFIWVVPGEYVAKQGCNDQHLMRSLEFLRESTQRFSAEGAIRPFLNYYPKQAMAFVHACAEHKNYHVRRLASEGIRPLLPWAERVAVSPAEIVKVLDILHADSTRYVTRSVANNLNDISKLEPELVVATLGAWHRANKQAPKELAWMTKHALRTLSKTDHAASLQLLGFTARPAFRLVDVEVSGTVRLGEALLWQGTLHAKIKQKLKLTLKLEYLKANNTHRAKVFTLKELMLEKGQQVELSKKIPFKPVTTRTLYPGTHYVELLVNGVAVDKRSFEFVID